jgi:hypothetical protein
MDGDGWSFEIETCRRSACLPAAASSVAADAIRKMWAEGLGPAKIARWPSLGLQAKAGQRASLNKRTLLTSSRQRGGDPIVGMARIAINKKNPVELRARMFAELSQYVTPKRKALELSADAGAIKALLARIDLSPE